MSFSFISSPGKLFTFYILTANLTNSVVVWSSECLALSSGLLAWSVKPDFIVSVVWRTVLYTGNLVTRDLGFKDPGKASM